MQVISSMKTGLNLSPCKQLQVPNQKLFKDFDTLRDVLCSKLTVGDIAHIKM